MDEQKISPAEAQALADAAAQAMWQRDTNAHARGMELVAVSPGEATVRMRVAPDMVNGHHICHGGMLFTLADTAFAYACNSYNEMTVASGLSVDFVAPGKPGDVLVAEAREVSQAGRTGVYDVRICNGAGEVIALFRGRSYRMKGKPTVPAQD